MAIETSLLPSSDNKDEVLLKFLEWFSKKNPQKIR